MSATWGRLQRAGAVALVALSCAAALGHCALSDAVQFLPPDSGPAWWMAPVPVNAELQQWGRAATPVTRFTRRFELPAPPGRVTLALRALGRFTLRVNGEVPLGGVGDGTRWRALREVELTPWLRKGPNEIVVEVENRHGPGLLSLSLSGAPGEPSVPDDWQVALDDRLLGRAVLADDTRRDPSTLDVETPAEALRRRAGALLGLFALGGAGFVLGRRWLGARALAWLPGAVLGAVCLAWAWLFTARIVRIPLLLGFDSRHHLAYVAYLREMHAVPLATDGWSMFHPPLFYGLAALLEPIGERALRVLPWISGLGSVFVAHALAQRLHPGDARVAALAVLFAAVLPVNLYSSAYFTNESFHALLAGVALVACVDALLARRTTLGQAAWLGLWLGLAALAKFTALAIAPVALFFLACKLVAVERARWTRVVGLVALAAVVWVGISGWYYARNWIELGAPIAGNWGRLPGTRAWWQQPGFHTVAWYTGFGESLIHPYLAGFHSFADGIYSTFWGDGYVGGRVSPEYRHSFWNYDFVSAAYWLGLVATALLGFGALRALRRAFRDPEPRMRAALSFLLTSCYAVGFSLLVLTASLPYFAQAKGSYALSLVAPLALFFADAAARVDASLASRPGADFWRAGYAGLLTAVLGGFFLGYAG